MPYCPYLFRIDWEADLIRYVQRALAQMIDRGQVLCPTDVASMLKDRVAQAPFSTPPSMHQIIDVLVHECEFKRNARKATNECATRKALNMTDMGNMEASDVKAAIFVIDRQKDIRSLI